MCDPFPWLDSPRADTKGHEIPSDNVFGMGGVEPQRQRLGPSLSLMHNVNLALSLFQHQLENKIPV